MDKTGGPAFPCTTGSDGGIYQCGMILWDYFAAHAPVHENWASKVKAEEAANFADAMIAEREKRFKKEE